MGTLNKKDSKTYWHEHVGAKLDYDYRTNVLGKVFLHWVKKNL